MITLTKIIRSDCQLPYNFSMMVSSFCEGKSENVVTSRVLW